MNNHEELLKEAEEARNGMSAKEMREWQFDHIWVMNKEFGILGGVVEGLRGRVRGVEKGMERMWKVVIAGLAAFLGLVAFLVQRIIGG